MLADDGALQVFYTEAPVSGVVFKGERIVAGADAVHEGGAAYAQDGAGFFGTDVLREAGIAELLDQVGQAVNLGLQRIVVLIYDPGKELGHRACGCGHYDDDEDDVIGFLVEVYDVSIVTHADD